MQEDSSGNSLTDVTTIPPTTGQWTPTPPIHPAPRARTWPAVALSAVAAVLGAAASIVALTRPAASGTTAAPGTSAPPTYTAAEVAAAHQKLCDVYKAAARAVQIDTNSDNSALSRIATVNGAVMLEQAVAAVPALAPDDRATAVALAEAYTNANAVASVTYRDDPAWRSAADDVNAKDARMKAVCGGG